MADMTVTLDGRRALVTGATKGIGREVALRLARAGADVGATGRVEAELRSLEAEVRALGRRCWTRAADLRSREETMAMAEHFARVMDPIDILVNNAGTAITETLLTLEPDHWDTVIAVNLTAPALVSTSSSTRRKSPHNRGLTSTTRRLRPNWRNWAKPTANWGPPSASSMPSMHSGPK